jgi:hypothetical protein
MFSRSTVFVWIGVILLSGMFLMGQDTWAPQEKIVFVTEDSYPGDLGGLTGADAICQAEADGAGLTGTYMAWLSDSVVGPDTRFAKSTGPYVLVNGDQVASNWADLVDGHLNVSIRRDAEGSIWLGGPVWTNTTPKGEPLNTSVEPPFDCCGNWMENLNSHTGSTGAFNYIDARWTEYGTSDCETPLKLYCFQQ